MAKGWGPGTRERQHASCDIIPERWGERTHPRTQAQLTLNRSALAAVRFQLPTLASEVGKTNFTLDISAAAASEEEAASRPCQCCCPARYFPVLATAVPGACICVCAWCSKALHLPVCLQGVIVAPRVRQHSQRDIHGVRLMAHDADVPSRFYDISVNTCCGNFRASVVLSRWVLCGPSLLDWSDAEYASFFWMQGGVPCQFRMSPGM